MNQADLAAKAGLSAGYVGMLESGTRSHPTLKSVEALAEALNVRVDQIAVRDSVANSPPTEECVDPPSTSDEI